MISFFTQDVDFPFKARAVKSRLRKYMLALLENENKAAGDICIIFCADEYLININKQYLEHDYYTDVISFDYSNSSKISGDIFISLDTVLRNAETYAPSFEHELYRVIFHGLLHLCGYNDKSEDEVELMREKENFYLKQNNLD